MSGSTGTSDYKKNAGAALLLLLLVNGTPKTQYVRFLLGMVSSMALYTLIVLQVPRRGQEGFK